MKAASLLLPLTALIFAGTSSAYGSTQPLSLDAIAKRAELLKSSSLLITPVNPPAAPVQPTVEALLMQECTPEFVTAYASAAGQISIIATYLKINEMPPNVSEAGIACNALQVGFNGVTCAVKALSATLNTADFDQACQVVRDLMPPTDPSQPAPAPASDLSLVTSLTPAKVSIVINDVAAVQNVSDNAKTTFIIDGKVYDLVSALDADSDVRCTVVADPDAGLVKFTAGPIAVSKISEDFMEAGLRRVFIQMKEPRAGLVCINETGSGLTLGALKKALGGLLTITASP